MIIVFLGPPGSGKGTQAALLARRCGMVHLSTGELLRAARSSDTSLGKEASRYMDRGSLVPDHLVSGLVEERISCNDEDFLLDGFPRNLTQAADLQEILSHSGRTLTSVILLEVHEEELLSRLSNRGRSDDDPKPLMQRLEVYRKETKPLIGYYSSKNMLRRIEGIGSIEEIGSRIGQTLGQTLGHICSESSASL